MYTVINYPTKVAMKRAIVANGTAGSVYQPNDDLTGAVPPDNGVVTVEGPHYPKPHTWYARVLLKDGAIIRVVA
jgi:hypothetical protein